jgi:hypothetical protein
MGDMKADKVGCAQEYLQGRILDAVLLLFRFGESLASEIENPHAEGVRPFRNRAPDLPHPDDPQRPVI